MKNFILAAAFLVFCAASVRAQTYTPVPYNFPSAPRSAPNTYSDGSTAYDETINSMAANGYGLWLSGLDGSGKPTWKLAGYGLNQKSSGSNPPVPNGTIASGSDDHGITCGGQPAQQTKVAANLLGSVRYVSINTDDNGFLIYGFDDAQCGGVAHQLSINIPYSSTDNVFTDPSRQNPVESGEYYYGTASTKVYGEPVVCSPQYELIGDATSGSACWGVGSVCSTEPIDWDIAMDGHFLYIVWYHNELQTIPDSDTYWSGHEIFVTCVDLKTCTTQAGFPVKLHTRPGGTDNTGPGCGTQPTVACDVRNNSTGSTFTPSCEIAYVNDFGAVCHLSVVVSAGVPTVHYEALPTNVLVPTDSTVYPYHPYISQPIPTPAYRSRIMVASSGRGMHNKVIGYYVEAGSGTALYFFDEVDGVFQPSGQAYGWYVDGPANPPHNNSWQWQPEASPIGGYGQSVYFQTSPSTQITAFANPYDGENDSNYDEFHCVYTVASLAGDGLMIVRGADNGMPWPTTPFPYQINTRTVVNQSYNQPMDPPNLYCAAVNQAGIHIRWEGGSPDSEYYMRDRRAFDEPIEENTIMSYDNYIADGRSHAGTLGAQPNAGKNILVWSDPIDFKYIPSSLNHAWIYFGTPSAAADTAGLTIGTTTGTDPITKLIIFPNTICQFQSPSSAYKRNFIQINRTGICDYYAGSDSEIQQNFIGGGDFWLYSNTPSAPIPTLNVMPGCNFSMVNQDTTGFPRLMSPTGSIACMTGIGENMLTTDNGIITIDGAIQSDYLSLTSNAAWGPTLTNVLTLNGEKKCPFDSYINYGSLTDTGTNKGALLYLHDPLYEISINQSTLNGIGISGYWADHSGDSPLPNRPLYVSQCIFSNIPAHALHITRATDTTDKIDYFFDINENSFGNFLYKGYDGILFEDFASNIPGDLADTIPQISITSNIFDTASTFGADTGKVEAAIHLRNTSAVVDNNNINGVRANGTSTYAYGILLDPSALNLGKTQISNTLICSNTISHVGYNPSGDSETGAGIATSYWRGYEKMNDIFNSAQGSIFGVHDAGKYLVDSIHDNKGPGVNNTANSSTVTTVEMRGLIHPDTTGDMGGFNVIKNNNLDGTLGEIVLDEGVTLRFGNEVNTGSHTVTYGQNSIIENTTTTDKLVYAANETSYIGNNGPDTDNCMSSNYYQVAGSTYRPPVYWPNGTYGPFGGYGTFGYHNIEYYSGEWALVSILDSVPPNPGISCYDGGNFVTKKGSQLPQSAKADTATVDDCWRMDNNEEWLEGVDDQKAYDTAKAYLTLCYNQRDAIGMLSHIWGDNDNRNSDPNRYIEFREWLKSVLYLRTDTEWYCADVMDILHTVAEYYDAAHGGYANAQAAIDRYILDHNRCDSNFTPFFKQDLSDYPNDLIRVWEDTVKDSSKEPKPDTTVPSIDSIGLSILRGPQEVVHTGSFPSGTSEISDLYATENPFTNATEIKFNLADYGLVTFQLYDLLGHEVTTNGIGQVLYPGEHEFDIDGSKLAPGTYIARVAFHDGDVQSIMVVRK